MQAETLTDKNEAEWGKTRIDYTLEMRRRVRAKARARRAKYLKSLSVRERDEKGRFSAHKYDKPYDGEVFETASGVKAYRRFIQNTGHTGGDFKRSHYEGTFVSLPYVSILHIH